MLNKKSELGQFGENIAANYLVSKKYRIVERNHRQKWGEIDIVAISPEKILVFVEVKTVTGPNPQIIPEDQMTKTKLKRLRKTAEIYANGVGTNLVRRSGWRIDLIAVVKSGEGAKIKHYKNV
jgi:putative endonuclease